MTNLEKRIDATREKYTRGIVPRYTRGIVPKYTRGLVPVHTRYDEYGRKKENGLT